MKSFFKGIKFYFEGEFFAFSQVQLRKIIFLNIFINIILFFLTFSFLSAKMIQFLKIKIAAPKIWYDYLTQVGAYGLGALIVILSSGIVVYAMSSVLMVGVGDYLSKKVLKLKNALPESKTQWSLLRIFGLIFKVLMLLVLSLMAFTVSLIPGLGLIGIYLAALVMTFDMLDYGFDHYHLTLKERFTFFRSNIKVIGGYAFAMMFFLLIPGFNILMLPGSVVAASYMLAELKKG